MSNLPARRFTAAADFALPDLVSLDPVDSVDTTSEVIEDTHYDTREGHLRQSGMDLYRRKDSAGATWHLQTADGDDGDLLASESKATTPPREISELLTAIRGGKRLVSTEKVHRVQDVHVLHDRDGKVLTLIQDSELTRSHPHGEFEPVVWREIEVAHGPAATKANRKMIRKLLEGQATTPLDAIKAAGSVRRQRSRADFKGLPKMVDSYVQQQLTAIAFGDLELRCGGDGVHQTRVAIRRLRSALHVFADVFDQAKAQQLSAELAWFGGLLGIARDVQIAGRRIDGLLDSPPFVADPSRARAYIDTAVTSMAQDANESVMIAMSGRRYAALVELLDKWRTQPAYAQDVSLGRRAAPRYVTAIREKLHTKLRRSAKKKAGVEDLHRARKVAKRLRYSAELAESVLPKGGRSQQREGHRWQRRLGEIQDLQVTTQFLAQLGAEAPDASIAFDIGVLWHQERERAHRSYAALVRKVR